MADENYCPECGSPIPGNAPQGLCPRCLLRPGWAEGADPTIAPAGAPASLGSRIDRYELIELIGEGGMGLVYLAEQREPVRRRVALKIIKPGMDSKQVVARFEAERQALALLQHPSIARVFDGGTTESGLPYFVMEYVKGLPLNEYCDQQKLSVPERLTLFGQVCEAVHHAHQKGIIHRDLKPSNVLVALDGEKATPMIIDFGIAKALSRPLTERTLVTSPGQFVGTLEYMSPEQANLAVQDVDIRSDIYSLGVVLYELLTGVLPFDPQELRERSFECVRKAITEQEPVTPSIRLTRLGHEAARIASERRTNPAALARRLGRELEWIPLKAMRKDRAHRYKSASEFGADIQNYLNGSPLIAGPESATYRMGKFIRRHRVLVAAGLTLVIGLAVGLAVTLAMYISFQRSLDHIFRP